MSQQSDVSAQSDANDLTSSADGPAMDSSFELLEDPDAMQSHDDDEGVYWLASSDSSEPMGPVSLVEIQKQVNSGAINSDFLVWRKGMQQWAQLADQFDIPQSASSASKIPLPPPLPSNSGYSKTSEVLDFVGNWHPTSYFLRCLARFTIAFGLLTIVVSLVLAPFGISWFSGGLQIVLIGAILELAAVLSTAFPPSASARVEKRDITEEHTT
jgi:hypothetical protein